MKISYIITTIRPPSLVKITIDSIRALDNHNYDITLVSPNPDYIPITQSWGVNYIKDLGGAGSVGPNNMAIKHTTGDWLTYLPDDFKLINLDINKFQDFLAGPEMKKKTFKMFSLHPRSGHKIDGVEYETPIDEPYQVMHFPVIARETIENKLDGVVFNEHFFHSYVDHFLGFYASKHEQYEPFNYSLYPEAGPFITLNTQTQYRNHSNDDYDYRTLDRLYREFKQNPAMKYNS